MSVASLKSALTRFTRLRFTPVRVVPVRSIPLQSGAQGKVMGSSCAGMLTAASASTATSRGPRSRGLIPSIIGTKEQPPSRLADTDSPHLHPPTRRDLGQRRRWRRMMAT